MKKVLMTVLPLVLVVLMVMTGCQAPAKESEAPADAAEAPADAAEAPADAAEAPADGEKLTVALSVMNTAEFFYKDIQDGFEDCAAEYGADTIINSAEGDLAKQISQTEDFIINKVNAIVLVPADSEGIVPAVKKANEAGIPLVCADTFSNGGELASFVASDNAKGGELAAELLAQLMEEEGDVIILDEMKVTSILERSEGFVKYMEQFPNIKIVQRTNVGYTRDANMKVVEDLMLAYPNLKGIFGAWGGEAGVGAEAAVKAAGKSDSIFIVNFDASPDSLAVIKNDGAIKGDVAQNAYQIGYQACEAAIKTARGQGDTVEKVISIPVELVTKENVADYER